MKFFQSGAFGVPLPPGHRFPGAKYQLLHEALLARGVVSAGQCFLSPPADAQDVAAAHSPDYVNAVLNGELSAKEQRRIGLPWSKHLAERALATMGGAIEAARAALETGFSAQLAGGTHHAHAGFGSGYCVSTTSRL
jgi:acetoin utilization deacetylase AcuC-like enzyme